MHRRTSLVVALLCLLSLTLGCPGGGGDAPEEAWADLHAHPMAHVTMGHSPPSDTCDKHVGLFHGRPGETFDPANPDATILDDLDACDIADHAHCVSGDAVKDIQRAALLSLFEDAHEDHTSSGAPDFGSWPSANSRLHQQMHLKWLHRAYSGGLRLMIASLTENELVSKFYNDDINCNVDGEVFRHEDTFNFDSAMEQLQLLKALDQMTDDVGGDELPGDWFDIAYSAAEAQEIYDKGKLVLILGVELDTLEVDQVDALWDEGVRSFIPIHLTDNAFGGTAVYNDVFNALSNWQNGGIEAPYHFYSVEGDPTLSTRLGHPDVLRQEPALLGEFLPIGCATVPRKISDDDWTALGYAAIEPQLGHRNTLGLTETGESVLTELMARGALVDIAHMSWRATEDALEKAESYGFPVINSHTGLRAGTVGELAREREMTFAHARRVVALGGMIGLGTIGAPGRDLLGFGVGAPFVRFTNEGRSWRMWRERDPRVARPLGTKVSHLEIRVMTGEDDLRDGDGLALQPSRAWLELRLTDGRSVTYDLNESVGWAGGAVKDVSWDLTASDPRASETVGEIDLEAITGLGLRFQSGGGWTEGDSWRVDLFEVAYRGVDASGAPRFAPLVERYGRPFRVMSNNLTSFSVEPGSQRPVDRSLATQVLDRLEVTATIGADSGGERVDVVVVRNDGWPDIRGKFRVLAGVGDGGWQNSGDTATATLDLLPYGLTYGEVEGVYLEGFSDRSGNGDLWQELDIATARASFVDTSGTVHEIADFESDDKRGFPTFRFSAPFSSGVLWQGLTDASTAPATVQNLGVTLTTGQDNLRGDSVVTLTLWMHDGTVRELRLGGSGFALGGGESHDFRRLPLSPPLNPADVAALGLAFVPTGGSLGADNWNVDRIHVWAQTDPLATWVEELERVVDALQVGSEAPLAFGTDLNGFEVQLPYTDPVDDLPQTLDALPPGMDLPRGETTGTHTFTLEKDGFAHVGLFPDLVDRIVRRSSPQASAPLLQSAQRTITTWADAEAAGATIAATLDAGPPASPVDGGP